MRRRGKFRRILAALLALLLALPLGALAEAAAPEELSDAAPIEEAIDPAGDAGAEPEPTGEAEQVPDEEAPALPEDEALPEPEALPDFAVRIECGEDFALRARIEWDEGAEAREFQWQVAELDAYLAALDAQAEDLDELWSDVEGENGDALDAFARFGDARFEYIYRCVARLGELEAASEPFRFPEMEEVPEKAAEPSPEEAGAEEEHPLIEAEPEPGAELRFAQASVRIGKGERYLPELIVNGDIGEIAFASNKPKVFSVDPETGEIEGLAVGKGTLTASAGSLSASVQVQVLAAPKRFALQPAELVLGVGEEAAIEAVPAKNTFGHVKEWRSGNEGVATVANGQVRAVAPGEAIITAILYNDKEAECAVSVRKAPSAGNMSVALPEGRGDGAIGVGESVQASVRYESAAGAYSFRSGDETVAAVDANGRITGIAPGEMSIVAEAYNQVTAELQIVVKPSPEKVVFENAPKSLGIGEPWTLSAKLTNKEGAECGGAISFKSSKPGVLAVDATTGLLTAKKKGTARITATAYNKKKASVSISVKPAPTDLQLSATRLELGVEQPEVQLKAMFGNKKQFGNVNWFSGDERIVTVSQSGELTPVSVGETEVTAQVYNASGAAFVRRCAVSVKEKPREGGVSVVFLDAEGNEKAALGVGESVAPKVVFAEGTGGGYTLKSSKKAVVAVNKDGTVKGKKAGRAVITATTYNGITGSVEIQVVAAPKKLRLTNVPQEPLPKGEQWQLGVEILDKKNKPMSGIKHSFTSSDPEVLAVDEQTGLLTAMKLSGSAKITAKTYNGKSASVTISVKEAERNVFLSCARLTLLQGRSARLYPRLANLNGKKIEDLSWSSTDEAVASVDGGLVTAEGIGTATISVSIKDTINAAKTLHAECEVTVKASGASLELDRTYLKMAAGEREELLPELLNMPGADASEISWKCDNPWVAEVSGGVVAAKAAGRANITASLNYGGETLTAMCGVSVVAERPSLQMSATQLELMAEQDAILSATSRATTNPGKVSWSSSDESVARVYNGYVSALQAGTAIISATLVDVDREGYTQTCSAQCMVNVRARPVEVLLSYSALSLRVGQSETLSAMVMGLPGVDSGDVEWTSSAPEVASVEGGKVTALSAGEARIIARATDGSTSAEAECLVTVANVPVALSLSLTRMNLKPDEGRLLLAQIVGMPEPAPEPANLRWESSDSRVARVEDGYVTAVSEGIATITARADHPRQPNGTLAASCEVRVVGDWAKAPKAEGTRRTDEGRIEVSWTGGSADHYAVYELVDGFEILVATIDASDIGGSVEAFGLNGISAIALGDIGAAGLSGKLDLSGLSAGEHQFVIRPYVKNGLEMIVGDASEVLTIRVESWQAPVTMETGAEASEEPGYVELSWEAKQGAQSYNVYEMDMTGALRLVGSTKQPKAKLRTEVGGAHYFAVRAVVDGKEGNLSRPIYVHVNALRLGAEELQLMVGNSKQISFELNLPQGVSRALSWESSDEKIATVSASGRVTGIAPGSVAISARSVDGSVAECQVSVYESAPNVESTAVFTIEDGILRHYSGNQSHVVIPYGVTMINDGWTGYSVFGGHSEIVSIEIPDTVTYIEDACFRYCTGLKSVVLPEGLEEIGRWTFEYCSSLQSVTLPESLKVINKEAFLKCESLTNVNFPSKLEKIYGSAFEETNLHEVVLPGTIDIVGNESFSHCFNLESFTILPGEGSVYFGNWPFAFDQKLKRASIMKDVREMELHCFEYCTALESVTFGGGIANPWTGIFLNCISLREVNYHEGSATVIGAECFSGCASLKHITLPEGVTTIGTEAFNRSVYYDDDSDTKYEMRLESVSFPKSLRRIGAYAFAGSDIDSVVIPDGLTHIDNSAFKNCSKLRNVLLPDTLQQLGEQTNDGYYPVSEGEAFYNCDSLESIVIPAKVKRLEKSTFENCDNLREVILPDGLNYIGYEAFNNTPRLQSIVIPDTVNYISNDAFGLKKNWHTVVICSRGSYAESWAIKNNYPYQALDSLPHDRRVIGTGMRMDVRNLLGEPKDAGGYHSYDESIATVNELGILRGERPGSTQISDARGRHQYDVTVVGFEEPHIDASQNMIIQQEPQGISGEWSSSNDSVATVDQSGMVTCVGEGSALIRLSASNGITASYTVRVCKRMSKILLDPPYVLMGQDETYRIEPKALDGEFSPTYSYKCYDTGIATVDASGVIHPAGPGHTQIQITPSNATSVHLLVDVCVGNVSGEELRDTVESIKSSHEQLVNRHKYFDGGYYDQDGIWVEQMDMSWVKNNLYLSGFDLLGDMNAIKNYLTPDSFYLTEKILSDMTEEVTELWMSKEALGVMFDFLGDSETLLTDFYEVFDITSDNIDMGAIKEEDFEGWLRAQEKKNTLDDMEELREVKQSMEFFKLLAELIHKVCRYMNVDRKELNQVINQLKKSDDAVLYNTGKLLQDITVDLPTLMGAVATGMGFEFALDKFLSDLQSKGWEKLTSVFGPMGIILTVSKDVSMGFANDYCNASAIQGAAYTFLDSVRIAGSFLPTYEAAYEKFIANPAGVSETENYQQVEKTFARLVSIEYSEYSGYVKATGEADRAEVRRTLKQAVADTDRAIRTLDDIGDAVRKELQTKLDYYVDASNILR